MKVTLHLEGTRQEIIEQLSEFQTVLATSLDKQPPAGKRGRKAKEEPVEETEEEEEQEENEEEENEEEDEKEESEEEEDAPPPKKSKVTLEQVTKLLKSFSARGEDEKDQAKRVLKKYLPKGKNHVDDLPEKHYADVIKALK